jgi:hypothetical protein
MLKTPIFGLSILSSPVVELDNMLELAYYRVKQ